MKRARLVDTNEIPLLLPRANEQIGATLASLAAGSSTTP